MDLNPTNRCFLMITIMCAVVAVIAIGEDKGPAAGPKAEAPTDARVQERFVGQWCNKDFKTGGVTRIFTYIDGGKLQVHMWGRCSPKECDWGEVTASLDPNDGNAILLTWDHTFAVRTHKLTLDIDGTLQLSGKTVYKDNSGRKPQKEEGVYINGLKHDWTDH